MKDRWQIDFNIEPVTASFYRSKFAIPQFQVFFLPTLNFHIRVFGWMLQKNHDIYLKFDQSLKKVTLSNLIQESLQYDICIGVSLPVFNCKIFFYRENHTKFYFIFSPFENMYCWKYCFRNVNYRSNKKYFLKLKFLNFQFFTTE